MIKTKEVLTTMALSQAYSISAEVLYQEVNGEVVLLSMETGRYYGLNEVATKLWHLLAGNGKIENAIYVLLDEYDVSEEEIRADVSEIVAKLVGDGLLIRSDDQVN